MKKITKNDLKNVEVEVTKNGGFVVWITENGKKHWVLDGSRMKEDGEINLGTYDGHKTKAKYNKKKNSIHLVSKN